MTAQGVAVARALIERPEWPSGDAAADDRLVASLVDGVIGAQAELRQRGDSRFLGWLHARTRFFDENLVVALRAGIEQIVVLGAGYDGRALRYRTPNVQFF